MKAKVDPDVGAHLERAVAVALEEDLGPGADPAADVTTVGSVPEDAVAGAVVVAKAAGVVCGVGALEATFGRLDARVVVELHRRDGDEVAPGDVIASLRGPARALLVGERTALNIMGHLSGVATLVRAFVARAPGVQITETRKTTPGLRALEKAAVRAGGGSNHRFALWDGILVKDNHIAAAGGITNAVKGLKDTTTLPVEVECTSRDEVDEALSSGADEILLDNRDPDQLSTLVSQIRERSPDTVIEASGNVTLENVEAVAAAGVDRISVGAFTHSAPALDLSMRLLTKEDD